MNRLILSALLLLTSIASAASPDQIVGTWLTANGESKIEISKCADAYCGAIVWMQSPKNDIHNSDPALKGRPLVGVQIATGFKFEGGNTWGGGKLYGPERGKIVDAKMVINGDSLDVKASAGMAKKTVTWTRVK